MSIAIFHVILPHTKITIPVDADEVARGTHTIVPESDGDGAIRVDFDASAVEIVESIHFSKELAVSIFLAVLASANGLQSKPTLILAPEVESRNDPSYF